MYLKIHFKYISIHIQYSLHKMEKVWLILTGYPLVYLKWNNRAVTQSKSRPLHRCYVLHEQVKANLNEMNQNCEKRVQTSCRVTDDVILKTKLRLFPQKVAQQATESWGVFSLFIYFYCSNIHLIFQCCKNQKIFLYCFLIQKTLELKDGLLFFHRSTHCISWKRIKIHQWTSM